MLDKILTSVRYATVSTVDENGLPWAAPVWYVTDSHNNIYWWSPIKSQHSINIHKNPSVYITVFDSSLPEGKGVGLYVRAKAYEINDLNEVKDAIDQYNKTTKVFNLTLDDCLGDAPTRMYKAIPSKLWINSDDETNGHYIDIRKEIA